MISWIVITALLLTLAPYSYFLVRGKTGWTRIALVLPACAAAFSMPFLLPPEQMELRFVLALLAFIGAVKVVETAWGRIGDPEMGATYGRFLIWTSVGPDTGIAATSAERPIDGLKRMLTLILLRTT